jgi:hypothetical protein
MSDQCYSSIQGVVMRGTRVTRCGVPVTGGSTDQCVSDGFVSIKLTRVVEDGTDYKSKNAHGKLKVSKKGKPQLTGYTGEAHFVGVEPALFELMTGVRLLTNWNGDLVGYAQDRDIDSDGFGLEVWTEVPSSPDVTCTTDGLWIYWLVPWCVDGILGDYEIHDALVDFSMFFRSEHANQWGVGPYDVVPADGSNTPGKIDSPGVLRTEHLYHRLTTIEPPTAVCGYVAA